MSTYSEKLRLERKQALALRATTFAMVTKSEGDAGNFPASDYAYVPDPESPSTWKLRLTATPGGDPDPQIVGAAVAALGKGFRGNKVQIPEADLPKVKAKVKVAWKKANPDKKEEDIPAIIACGDMVHDGTQFNLQSNDEDILNELSDLHGEIEDLLDGYEADSPEVQRFLDATVKAVTDADDKIDILLGDPVSSEENNDSSDLMNNYSSLEGETEEFASCSSASKRVQRARRSLRRAIVAYRRCTGGVVVYRPPMTPPPPPPPPPPPGQGMAGNTYEVEIKEIELAGLPPFLKAGIIKGLEKKLAAEKDPEKKKEIQAKIDKLKK